VTHAFDSQVRGPGRNGCIAERHRAAVGLWRRPAGHDDIGAHDDNNDGTSAGVSAGARCDDHDVDTYGANDSVIFSAKEEKVLLF
jgi:hypothetical protein